jgi:glucosyltransferase
MISFNEVKFVQNPLVSIIIPSFNRMDTIEQTIKSIICQKCNFKFEIIIGDDCSTDQVRSILTRYKEEFPHLIKLIFHDHNIGLGANWASCVKQSKGRYIANCDNEDYWHNCDKLQIQVDFMDKHLEYGMCHTDYRIHNRISGKIDNVKISNSNFKEYDLQKAVFNGEFKCCNASVLYRKELIDKYINLDDYINLQFTLQDCNTWMILSKYTNFYCLPISTSTFGVETQSITRPNSFEKLELRLKKERECYRYICNLFTNDFPYNEKDYDEYMNSIYFNLAFVKNDFKKAKEYGLKIRTNKIKFICSQHILLFYLFCFFKNNRS